jgi:Tol biopolymer transport system component/DNA-binding winged helix-turn-helix (wHTH) protein
LSDDSTPARVARFGTFEADLIKGELRRQGRFVPIQDQPFAVLTALLDSPDHEVSREQLRRLLWPNEEFLDFDNGINAAVAKLRQALGDSADNPRFIATRPRRGYRFIAPTEWVGVTNNVVAGSNVGVETRVARIPVALAIVVVAALGVATLLRSSSSAPNLFSSPLLTRHTTAEAAELEVFVPAGEVPTGSFALAPDGKSLAFVTAGATADEARLWLRSLDGAGRAARVLAGTDGAAMPFWSPDGRAIGFFAHGTLKTVDLDRGVISSIADAPRGRGGSWGSSGRILFAPDVDTPIYEVAAAGGSVRRVTDLGDAPSHRFPVFLPDGRHFIFLALRADRDESEIRSGDVHGTSSERVVAATSNAEHMVSGYLLFARGSSLFAAKFDAASCRVVGQPLLAAERVGVYGEDGPTGLGAFSVSQTGAVAVADFVRPPVGMSWFDRAGHEIAANVPAADYTSFHITPDGRHVAVTRFDPRKRSSDLLTVDLRSAVITQVTDDPWPDSDPVWDLTGERLAFTSLRGGRWRIVVRDVRDAHRELELASYPYVYSWVPGGKSLVVGSPSAANGIDLLQLPVEPAASAAPLVTGRGNQTNGQMSPDRRWLAYTSDHEGRREIYLRDLATGDTHRVSTEGGESSLWRRDSRELFFLAGRTLWSASVRGAPRREIGRPLRLFDAPIPSGGGLGENSAAASFGVAPDGLRFLFPSARRDPGRSAIRVTRHWAAPAR